MGKALVRPHRINTDLFRPWVIHPNMVLFVGRLAPEKQVHLLIEAAARLPWVELHVAGGGPLWRVLEAMAGNAGVKAVFYGFQSQRLVSELMAVADIFVLPSKYEQASKVLLEAMASGCLVITSPGVARGEIEDGRTGYLCEPTTEGLVAALERAHVDPAAEHIRRSAREHVEAFHKKVPWGKFSACAANKTLVE